MEFGGIIFSWKNATFVAYLRVPALRITLAAMFLVIGRGGNEVT
jgi:hypothetical protein